MAILCEQSVRGELTGRPGCRSRELFISSPATLSHSSQSRNFYPSRCDVRAERRSPHRWTSASPAHRLALRVDSETQAPARHFAFRDSVAAQCCGMSLPGRRGAATQYAKSLKSRFYERWTIRSVCAPLWGKGRQHFQFARGDMIPN